MNRSSSFYEIASQIVATGSYLPEKVVENPELESELGLEPGWIEQRTGVVRRRVAQVDQAVSDMAIAAGRSLLEQVPSEQRELIGTVILATSTPDHLLPPTAPRVASDLGLGPVAAFDMAVACSGFLYGLQVADALCRVQGRSVLLIAANLLSRRTNPADFGTAAIFADGAGAVLVGPADEEPRIVDIELSSDGSGWDQLLIPDGGSRQPFGPSTLVEGRHLMRINNGQAVFRYAVESMTEMAERLLQRNDLKVEDIDLWIPHQANSRIIESVRKRLGLLPAQTCITLPEYGNSSAATIPTALDQQIRAGRELAGKWLLLTTAGAGLACGAALVRM
ncbi:MAG: beta-ketoacyl-ACP synthase 3 [Planctomycetota bacterium]|nr:beta-ketoacyl-ACP synthase 3 [Planctomycetota bacterium]